MDSQIQDIYKALIKYEDENIDPGKKEQIGNWLQQICHPDLALIDGLISLFIDNYQDPKMSHTILKVLKKLNENFQTLVGEQFFHNLKFPLALIMYMEETELQDMAGDAFILFINIFDEDTTTQHITQGFLQKIYSSLEFIEDDSTLNQLVSILVCLMPVFEKQNPDPEGIDGNPILKEFVEKEELYREKLIYLTNRGAEYGMDKCCKTLQIMLKKPKLATYYFNLNDLNLLLDILLREVTTTTASKTRVQLLKLLELVLDNQIYREDNYRIEDVEEMIQEQILYEDEEEEGEAASGKKQSDAELECIASINQFFQIEKKKANKN